MPFGMLRGSHSGASSGGSVAGKGRGSREAVEKRRAARALNTLVESLGGGPQHDGRTERRRKRLLKEAREGRRGQPLKPIDFVTHIDELLRLGETPSSLREHGIKPRKLPDDPRLRTVVERTQSAYQLDPRAWRMLGLRVEGATTRRRAKP
ncbi:MAG: hypothetical protein R3A78_02845 [Polyangiales bacterium]